MSYLEPSKEELEKLRQTGYDVKYMDVDGQMHSEHIDFNKPPCPYSCSIRLLTIIRGCKLDQWSFIDINEKRHNIPRQCPVRVCYNHYTDCPTYQSAKDRGVEEDDRDA